MGISRDIGDSLALLILCGICICYLPIFLNWRIKEQYIFDFDEDVHTNSLIASIAVAFPLMVDVIFNRDLPWKVILSRWMLLSSLIIPNLCDYLAIQSSSPEFASALIVCNKRARQMLCNGGLVTIYDRTVPYQRRVRVFFVCVGILANMCQCFVPFLHHSEATQSLQIIETICRVGGVIGMLFFCSYYCYCVLQRKETLTFLAKYCLVESVLLVVNIFAKGIYRSTLPLSGSNYSYQSYVGLIWIDTVTAVLAFVIPNRMAIEEASKVRVRLFTLSFILFQLVNVSSSKEFCSICEVRYFIIHIITVASHEVRTPLNTLSMGLDLLFSHDIFKITEEDINSGVFLNPSTLSSHTDLNVASVDASSSLPAIEERKDQQHSINKVTKLDKINDALDIVEAMRQSCETAICTLNDVLLYDKIEEGKMVLEKRKISVIQLLSQTIKPFYIQVSVFYSFSWIS